ncbi:hypothetical protein COL922a_014053 [Colletotrichum nupharicola]|nr:hypothetical protein COL922a_014053 [Colletotrichum nupharicola]
MGVELMADGDASNDMLAYEKILYAVTPFGDENHARAATYMMKAEGSGSPGGGGGYEAETRDEVAGFQSTYKEINPTPDWFMVHEASERGQPEILDDLLRRPQEMGIDGKEEPC